METFVSQLILQNWQRKLVALITALIIWLFVNHSIIETKIIANVPVRIVNIPPDKTIVGLLPSGVLSKRINLTLSGTKDVINELEPGDIRVDIDASGADQNEWIVSITKKNLVSLNPDIDLLQHITHITHNEFVIKLSRLVTVKVPINILPPSGEPPAGYEYLDFWPLKLTQTISGPEEEVQKLKTNGLDLVFDLNEITKEELDSIKSASDQIPDDEIRFLVPNRWKQVSIPFHNNVLEDINDPEAQTMRIYFLRKQVLPIEREIPISIFYPLLASDQLNPETIKLGPSKFIEIKNAIPVFTVPLYVKDVSRLFLNIIRDNLQLSIIAAPPKEREILEWSLEVINPKKLEDTYLAFLMTNLRSAKGGQNALPKRREALIRKRFQDYLYRLTLYVSSTQPLNLESNLLENQLIINNY